MTRNQRLAGRAVLTAFATGAAALTLALAGSAGTRDVQAARATVLQFFQRLNGGEFAKTCDLFSRQFYRDNHIPNKARCALGLRVTFASTAFVHVRIGAASVEGARVVVHVVASGAPGKIVLIRENGRFKLLALSAT